MLIVLHPAILHEITPWAKKTQTDYSLTLSLPESVTETFEMVLSFESVDEILWCDHSNETSLAVHSHGTIYMFKSILQN